MISKFKRSIARALGLRVPQRARSLVVGQLASIDPRVELHAGSVTVGDYSYISGPGRISSLPETNITIGKFVSIASGIQIIGALHKSHITNYSLTRLLPKDARARYEHGISKGDIYIGNDVWIGVNAIILSGVTIGNGAIIGAGSVVTKDIPPFTVAVGAPAKPIKKRFSDDDIALLQDVCWWDWDGEKILENIGHFYDASCSVSEFIARINGSREA